MVLQVRTVSFEYVVSFQVSVHMSFLRYERVDSLKGQGHRADFTLSTYRVPRLVQGASLHRSIQPF
jgi:hypothetical protein